MKKKKKKINLMFSKNNNNNKHQKVNPKKRIKMAITIKEENMKKRKVEKEDAMIEDLKVKKGIILSPNTRKKPGNKECKAVLLLLFKQLHRQDNLRKNKYGN